MKLQNFREDIQLQSWKIVCQRSQRLHRNAIVALGNPDCSFTVSERHAKFAIDVRVIIVLSVYTVLSLPDNSGK